MKNFEKYKNATEAYKAWDSFCNKQGESCEGCPANISKTNTFEICSIAWMHLEAEEELLPCPFCGGEAEYETRAGEKGLPDVFVVCTNCGIEAGTFSCEEGAKMMWNRRTEK